MTDDELCNRLQIELYRASVDEADLATTARRRMRSLLTDLNLRRRLRLAVEAARAAGHEDEAGALRETAAAPRRAEAQTRQDEAVLSRVAG